MNRRLFLQATAAAALISGCARWGLSSAVAAPADLDRGIAGLQSAWAEIQYETPQDKRAAAFEELSAKAHDLTTKYPTRAEPHIWEGIILSSWAGAKGGLGALSIAKRAKKEYETAIDIDSNALDGSALNSLGVLYYKVPGWPVGFGDNHQAEYYLKQALAINPAGIDPNYFYADYLVYRNHKQEAVPYLEKALQAPARPGRETADKGRRMDIERLLAEIRN
ncbi:MULTISPECIES: hypothetical protein [unclassified Achromobacter]|uniref:hypothetical protein n=1 Tax=unclassified Achromobacter TaxID=2626865 RepID=UPI000B5182A6|nr:MULTISPECIES: hypothetical protein [unclassified Achromobacter]OWT74687.1 hypothetical protein CEY05_19075 [Achromobacter sp. HZ34]OWT79154.1 hypothetical protein CEY04_08995 [Achromobacter sp. HZ28]